MSELEVHFDDGHGLDQVVQRAQDVPGQGSVNVYRLWYGCEEDDWDVYLAEGFARREDAELAKRALEEAGLDTYDKIEAHIAQHGRKAITRIMCEALQW